MFTCVRCLWTSSFGAFPSVAKMSGEDQAAARGLGAAPGAEIPRLEDAETGEGAGFQMPSVEQLLAMVDSMDGLSEEDRADLKLQLTRRQAGHAADGAALDQPSGLTAEVIVVAAAGVILLGLFVFFGYKLYRSLKDKERRKEEKRRLKQQKKKK